MIVRLGLLVAIVICVVLVGWWAASGFPMVSLACKQAHRLTLFRGPFFFTLLPFSSFRSAFQLAGAGLEIASTSVRRAP